jgi:uncharacterized membrane protein (UPF0127 family)
MRSLLVVAAVAALIGCSTEPGSAGAAAPTMKTSPAGLDIIPLEISSGARTHRFEVEVARTGAEQAQGLMYRKSLGASEGMLFPFSPARPASFWMKNTLIPLDMIFVRADGTIARIAANTVPHSLEGVGVEEPVAAVLEIAGGRSAQLGIREGDRVTWTDRR